MLNIDLYTSGLVNPFIQLQSRPRLILGLKENVSLDLVILNSSVSWGFVWVYLIRISQILVMDNSKSSVSFFGQVISKFIWSLFFN